MERLTRQDENGLLICYPNNKTGLGEFATQQNSYRRIIEKLAEYEDMEEIFRSKMTGISCDFLKDKEEFAKWLDRNIWTSKKLDEYARAEEQGKLLRLPVAVGETVYVVERYCELIGDCWNYPCESCPDYKTEINQKPFSLKMLDNVGESVFATREAAEAKLRERR